MLILTNIETSKPSGSLPRATSTDLVAAAFEANVVVSPGQAGVDKPDDGSNKPLPTEPIPLDDSNLMEATEEQVRQESIISDEIEGNAYKQRREAMS